MGRKERFMAQLEALAREYEAPLRGMELVKSRLRWENWELLSKEGLKCARQVIRQRKWRGERGGALPGGYDAESVAAEAMAEMLNGNSQLAFGWTRERVLKELERKIRQKARQLHRLKEAAALRSEWDVLPLNEAGEPVSVLAGLADERQDAERERDKLRKRVQAFLGEDRQASGVFECLWQGITTPDEIAQRLGMTKQEVKRARKRLDRRLAIFARENRISQ